MTEEEQKLWNDYNACDRAYGSEQENRLLAYYIEKHKPYCYKYAMKLMPKGEHDLMEASLIDCWVFMLSWIRKHDMSADFSVSFKYLKFKLIDFFGRESYNYSKYAKTHADAKNKNKTFLSILNIEGLTNSTGDEVDSNSLDFLCSNDVGLKSVQPKDMFNKIVKESSKVLTKREKQVFDLFFVEDKDPSEISKLTRVSKSRVSYLKLAIISKIQKMIIESKEFPDINSHIDLKDYI